MAGGDGGVLMGFEEATTSPPGASDHHHRHHTIPVEAREANKEWSSLASVQKRYEYHQGLHRPHPARQAESPPPATNSRSSRRHRQERPKILASNHTAQGGGSRMQAFFLNPSPRTSGGTGVFLPQMVGADSSDSLKNKPACAPVLLPTRVVRALNLNVQALGLQISPRQDVSDNKGISRDNNSEKKRKNGNGATQCCVVSENRSSSPHIFLPKEWTY